jgi:hypothetical protein
LLGSHRRLARRALCHAGFLDEGGSEHSISLSSRSFISPLPRCLSGHHCSGCCLDLGLACTISLGDLFQGEKSDYVCCLECGNVTNTDAVLFGISNSLSLPTGPLAPARTVPMPSWTCVKRYAKS